MGLEQLPVHLCPGLNLPPASLGTFLSLICPCALFLSLFLILAPLAAEVEAESAASVPGTTLSILTLLGGGFSSRFLYAERHGGSSPWGTEAALGLVG